MAKKLPTRSKSKSVAQRGLVARKVSVDAELLTELRGQIAAINKSQAVIEFDTSGNILTANDNFLNVVGYRLEEIKGQHHGMFVDSAYRASDEYRHFWEKLRAASSIPDNTGVSAKAAVRPGSRRATTRSSMPTASPTRSSSMPPTSPRRSI